MSLNVTVKKAVNLPNKDWTGKSDPYVVVHFQGQKKKTTVKKDTLDPVWDEDLEWVVGKKTPRADETLEIIVKDSNIAFDSFIGKSSVQMANILHGGSTNVEFDQVLVDNNGRETSGTLALSITYTPPQDSTIAKLDNEVERGYRGGIPTLPLKARNNLPDVITKFQIRVRVVEARQLLGEDLSPVCCVNFKDKKFQTKVNKSTISPWFNELFYFHEDGFPKDVMADHIELTVYNSCALRSDSLIGTFKCDVGLIYDRPEHAITNKWLLLVQPDEPIPTIQGYLRVSMAVLGPGDACPQTEHTINNSDDVESNLLWPAGVHLQPASFTLSVYCAQNLPRMDSGTWWPWTKKSAKELVDPYVVASYAGTKVQTRIIYNNDQPEFRQELHLGFVFPSMCNNIELTLMDWDRIGTDDVIGKAAIPVNLISAPGEDGYLPTFGPCFVPIYGARREWELWEGKENTKMNLGKDEGCSYRGRILVSLTTNVGSYPAAPTTEMADSAFNAIKAFRSTKNFVVVAHLTHAELLKEANRPLEIEVSMGNFGNKLETSILPSPSSTHPSNPLLDGCKHYFLPWGDSSPFLVINCQWEDITHRLKASNFLNKIVQESKESLKKLKLEIRSETNSEHQSRAKFIKKALTKLIKTCDNTLPQPDPIRHVESPMDLCLRKRRQNALKKIVSEAQKLKDESTERVLEELEIIIDKLEELSLEPQNSMPDVFLWLMSGAERLSFARIPPQHILFAHESDCSGKLAGKFNSFLLHYPEDATGSRIGGVLRASLWFGREEDLRSWWNPRSDLQLTVYAETYENQLSVLRSWSAKPTLMMRPAFSDADGLRELPKDFFTPSSGWKFQGDWFIDPDSSIKFSLDTGHTVFCEEVFEQQFRIVGGTWFDATTTWSDVRGDPATPKEQIECPNGWHWRDAWMPDLQRAVDCEGWEYTVQKELTGWSPQENLYHILRRRRWIRERQRDGKEEEVKLAEDGWEYSTLFKSRFHAKPTAIDVVRRRRWRRKLVPLDEGLPQTPRIIIKSEGNKEELGQNQFIYPRQYVISSEKHSYQLRAHIYQARDLIAGDTSGLSDPYATVTFCGITQQTERKSQTLSPTWNQTLVFDEVSISGPLTPYNEICQPPAVVVEIYDYDGRGIPDFLGRALCTPTIVDMENEYKPNKLLWYQLTQNKSSNQGEFLAAFELFLKDPFKDLPAAPPSMGDVFTLPLDIRPILQKSRIEVLCWGVRNMSTYKRSVTRPLIKFECGGQSVDSEIMKNAKRSPNFENPHLYFDVELPDEELYMPLLTIRVIDHRSFGSKPTVASAVISDIQKYKIKPKNLRKRSVLGQTQKSFATEEKTRDSDGSQGSNCSSATKGVPSRVVNKQSIIDGKIDWWSKYYASKSYQRMPGQYLTKGFEKMEIYDHPLEKESKYSNFTDLIETTPLYSGKSKDSIIVGEFKGAFRIYPLPSNDQETVPKILSQFPSPGSQEILVRVYVIKASDLVPKDSNNSDPYVVVRFGKEKKSGKEHYKAATLNPVFGCMYEVKGTIPLVKDLTIQVWDKDLVTSHDLIGETVIDLENRYLSRFRATVGLPKQYHSEGPNAWRDYQLPSQILEEKAKLYNMEGPYWSYEPLNLKLDGETFTLAEFESTDAFLPPTLGPARERLALHALHVVFTLVPEHVETRPLYHPERPGLSQGLIQLWVDLFPTNITIPPPVDISPRKPNKYILRICLYNVYDVPLQEENVFGEKMSDVYVKGWLQGTDNVQTTDNHYRCMDGEANFNWRFVFPFDFLEAEQTMILSKKTSFFTSEQTEEARPPFLTLQLWDDDLILFDDYLSETTLNLCRIRKPSKSLKKVTLLDDTSSSDNNDTATTKTNSFTLVNISEKDPIFVNLFEVKRIYGFFPFTKLSKSGELVIGGKLEAEIEVLTEFEARTRPAGQGRNEPNANPYLPEPNRPSTSFFWLSSPWKSFKHIVWKNNKWYIITSFVVFFFFLFILYAIFSIPEATANYLFRSFQ